MTSWWTWDRVLRALILGLALATIGSFFGGQAWWLDILADFKTQSVIGAALLTLLGLSLDHVLVGEEVSHASMRTGPRLGSDHLPVVGTFDLGK